MCAGDTFVSNSGTPSSGTSGSSPLSVTVTTTGSSPVSGPTVTDAATPLSVVQPQSSTPKRQSLNELLASIPGFSLRVRRHYCVISQHSFFTSAASKKNGKGSPYSITDHCVLELTPVLGSQPAGDVSHNPDDGRLPLLSTRRAVTAQSGRV